MIVSIVREMITNGTRTPEATPKSRRWRDRDIDRTAGLYGRRHATRVAGSSRQYGLANIFSGLSALDFMSGRGVTITDDKSHIVCALSGELIAHAPIAECVAYRIAAARRGVTLIVYNGEQA